MVSEEKVIVFLCTVNNLLLRLSVCRVQLVSNILLNTLVWKIRPMDVSFCFILQLWQVVFQILSICSFCVVIQWFIQLTGFTICKSFVNKLFVIRLSLSSIERIQLICIVFKFRCNFWKCIVVNMESIFSSLSVVYSHLESLIELELDLLSFCRVHELLVVGCEVLEFRWVYPFLCI